jgi:PadR family transcriptional regulator PadR
MLNLRTLLYGPAHGHSMGKHIQRTTNEFLQAQTARFTPRCIAWSEEGGLSPHARLRRTEVGNSSTTGFLRKAGSSSWAESWTGKQMAEALARVMGPVAEET